MLFCFGSLKNQTLPDMSKPYLGEYECKQATFSGRDYLQDFDFIRLELKKDESFILSFTEKAGKKHEVEGKYHYDKKKQTICFTIDEAEGFKREFPFQKGKMDINLSIAGKTLLLRFEQK